VLYWFRTPAGVRVGRAPLDEDAIRLIEEHHPHIRFDWPQILKGEEEVGFVAREPERRPTGNERRAPEAGRPAVAVEPRAAQLEPETAPPPVGESEPPIEPPFEPLNPAHAQLGSEGLARLRARYADVMAGISKRITDPERQEQLKTAADRLNPDTWVTDDEVRRGLEEYETVFESLRGVIGRRRRRRKSRSGQGNRPHEAAGSSAPGNSPEQAGEADPDDGDDADDQDGSHE
jgi:hypothetical protein